MLIALLLVFGVLFGGHYRVTEAGPYVSVMQDVLPALAALIVIITTLFNLRSTSLPLRICSLFCIAVSGLVIVNIVTLAIQFWSNPYARGEFWRFW